MERHEQPEHIHITLDLNAFEERLDRIDKHLHIINENIGANMAAIDALRAAQADETQAITDLGDLITSEAQQVADALAALVAAQGNAVTDADVAAAVASVDRIKAAGAAVAALVPDAPPVEPPA